MLVMIIPLFWVAVDNRSIEPGYRRVTVLTAVVFAIALVALLPGTSNALNHVHADAPALGLGLAACIVLARAPEIPGVGRLLCSALLTALACFVKQIELPLALALAVYLGVRYSWVCGLRFMGMWVMMVAALGALFGWIFGLPLMVLNMVTVPASQPWKGPALEALGKSAIALGLCGASLVLFLIPFWLRQRAQWKGEGGPAWLVLVLAGAAMVPTSLLGEAKAGGHFNSYHCLYYFVAAAAAALIQWAACSPTRVLACYLLAVVALAPSLRPLADFDYLDRVWNNPQSQAYAFSREHPGEAYFPWLPLGPLMAEGKAYHFEYGVIDRFLAGMSPKESHLRAFLPRDLKYVIFHQRNQSRYMLQYFPTYTRHYQVTRLADVPEVVRGAAPANEGGEWLVYVRAP
jgi:hypothetical protein